MDQRDEPGLGTVIWGVQCRGLKVTDDDIQSLSDCAQLRAVGLAETRVTNRSIPVLARLRHLESLDLTDTAVVDDVGIESLVGHPTLEFLHLARTGVTEEGLSKLSASIPRCEIVHHEVWIPPHQSPASRARWRTRREWVRAGVSLLPYGRPAGESIAQGVLLAAVVVVASAWLGSLVMMIRSYAMLGDRGWYVFEWYYDHVRLMRTTLFHWSWLFALLTMGLILLWIAFRRVRRRDAIDNA